MLAESAAALPIGTGIEVEMAGGARHRAEVVWRDADLFGCRFTKPLSQAILSAALLRAAPLAPPSTDAALVMNNGAIARLRKRWDFEGDAAATDNSALPLGQRMWIIVGLGLAGWAVPTALIAAAMA